MALRRVTIQDIADACGLSRNTVSKVFNNRGAVQEPTRLLVMRKAQELGYFQPAAEAVAPSALPTQNVALLTCHMPTDYHFGTSLIPAFAAQLSRAGYTLMMYDISEEKRRQGTLPEHINLGRTAAILAIELFDRDYIGRICELGLPLMIVDGPYDASTSLMNCDRVSMENQASTAMLVGHVLERGARRVGFVGDPMHCSSFHERYSSFCLALTNAGLSPDRELCILDSDDSPYDDAAWLTARLLRMPQLPDALVCVNDYIAIRVMSALKQLGVSIPGQIMVTGFDGTAQSAIVEPALTTVQIPGAEIGRIAADILLNRIGNPSRPFMSVYVKTTPIWRESTNRE